MESAVLDTRSMPSNVRSLHANEALGFAVIPVVSDSGWCIAPHAPLAN